MFHHPSKWYAAGPLAAFLFACLNSPAQTTSPSSSGETITLNPFVVSTAQDNGYLAANSASATRVSLLIQDTPMAINVVTKDFMNDIGGTDLNKALGYSAINSDSNPTSAGLSKSSDATFTVRGLQGNALFRDGFSAFGIVDMSNIDRVEIVKGPASVLYGNAAPGGLINYVTKQPEARDFSDVKATIGSYQYYQGQVDFNQTLDSSKSLLFRLNADVVNAGSFRRFEHTSLQFVAPSIKWVVDPNTTLSATVEAYKLHKNEPSPIPEYQVVDPVTGNFTVLKSILRMVPWNYNWAGPDAYNDRNKVNFTSMLDHAFSSNLSSRLSLNFFNDKGVGILGGNAPTPDHSPTSIKFNVFYQRAVDTRYAIRNDWNWKVATGSINHQVIVGAEHSFDDQYNRSINPNPPSTYLINPLTFASQPDSAFRIPAITDTVFWNYNTNQGISHGQTTVDGLYATDVVGVLDGRLTFLGGIRFDRLKQTDKVKKISASQTRSSPQISTLYKLTPTIGVYASYSTSVAPNGFTEQGQLFDPLKGIGKEAGFKFDLASHRFVGTVSLFDIQRVNIAQANFAINPITGVNTNTTSAGGKQQARGWDTNWVISLTDELQIVVDYLKTNPIFIKGRSGPTPTSPSPDQGLPTSRGLRQQFSTWGKYTFKKGDVKGLSFGMGVVYIAPFRIRGLGLEGYPRDSIELTPASAKVDASIGYEFKVNNRPVRFSLTGQNLFDRRISIEQSFSPLMAAPRTLLFTVDFKY